MTELELIVDLHKDSKRQGPGSVQDTLQALALMNLAKRENLKIADIGCGSGGQTLTLAENLDGEVAAVDLFPEFLEKLDSKSRELRLENQIRSLKLSMEDLPFSNEELDIIWSEGAIYNIGFKRGVQEWHKYLKPGGYLAVSEITWITGTRPKEIEDYWNKQYAEMDTASNKIQVLEENGYVPVGYFVLSPDSWLETYYKPLEDRFPAFLKKHKNSEMARNVVEEYQEEISIYRRYMDYYSYGFYVARKKMKNEE